jgi:hypothetical protein
MASMYMALLLHCVGGARSEGSHRQHNAGDTMQGVQGPRRIRTASRSMRSMLDDKGVIDDRRGVVVEDSLELDDEGAARSWVSDNGVGYIRTTLHALETIDSPWESFTRIYSFFPSGVFPKMSDSWLSSSSAVSSSKVLDRRVSALMREILSRDISLSISTRNSVRCLASTSVCGFACVMAFFRWSTVFV